MQVNCMYLHQGSIAACNETAWDVLRFRGCAVLRAEQRPRACTQTRLMAQQKQPDGSKKYRSFVHALTKIPREEGLRAMWRGLLPRLMRIPPGQAIVWAVSDQVSGQTCACGTKVSRRLTLQRLHEWLCTGSMPLGICIKLQHHSWLRRLCTCADHRLLRAQRDRHHQKGGRH